jgi:PKD repeat protein
MKKFILLLTLVSLTISLSAQTSGGPDSYGYTWKNSSHATNPPVFKWVDITTKGTLVTGLSDDNVVGPFNLSTSFHFYWYNISKFWIGSNGYVSFAGDNIASPFPVSIPLTGGANNWVAPLLADLIFTGTGNTARCYRYTNADSICISYIDVPFWENSTTGYTGSNSFQIILSRRDSSITFNYLKTISGNITSLDDAVGIENITGSLGLQTFIDALPPDTFCIKYYYPKTVTYSVTDAGLNWNMNSKNGGIFIKKTTTPFSLITNVRNFGNQNIGSFNVLDTVYYFSGAPGTTGTKRVYSLAVNTDTTFSFTNTFIPSTAGIYRYNTRLSGVTNDMTASNDFLTQEIVVIDTTQKTMALEYSDGTSEGSLGWNGGNGGVGVYIEPPFYPAKIVSSRFYIRANATPAVGFYALIYDDDGPNGTKGTLLDSVYVAPASITLNVYTTVMTASSNLKITSGGVYLFWNMGGAGINIGKDLTPPFSKRTYEILFNAWADYRDVLTEDFLMGINVEYTYPNADFTADSSLDPMISFTDKSNNVPTSWLWNFGDFSTNSTVQNPIHTFTTNGTFKVCLTATNSVGSTQKCKYQTIKKNPPVTDFSADSSLDPKIIFSDLSTNSPTLWKWYFGEKGATSTVKNPTYTYKINGYHQVCLKSSNLGGSDSICKIINIKNAKPTAGFLADTSLDPKIIFTDTTSNIPTSWKWNFGDLSTSVLKNPTHTYAANGTYKVSLKSTNSGGSDSVFKYIRIWKVPPIANFSIDTLLDPKFRFNDLSTNTPTSRVWYFGEKGATSTLKNPSYTYTILGDHLVCLKVTNAGGSDSTCKKITVRKLPPIGDFSTDISMDPTITFTDLTIGYPTAWFWKFDDKGATSGSQNPVYTFTTNGNHNVCLIVSNIAGSDTICKNVLINKLKPKSDFSYDPTFEPTIAFIDQSANIPTSWYWDFDDNSAFSITQNPSYAFGQNGDYNVCLIATNAGGSDTSCKTISITKIPPLADFSVNTTTDPLISFTDLSTKKPVSWHWDFDDNGSSSTLQNPTYSYKKNGSYQVCLKVTNTGGSDSICKTVVVNLAIPTANFTYDTTNMPAISFTDISTGTPTLWSWKFNETGNDSSKIQNPTFTFKTNGTHHVCLVASNINGSSAPFCKDIKITGIGVSENRISKSIRIYPNPFSESTIIEIQSADNYSNLELKCINSLGKKVEQKYSVSGNKIELQKGNMTQGYYFFEIINKGDIIGRGTILVQ